MQSKNYLRRKRFLDKIITYAYARIVEAEYIVTVPILKFSIRRYGSNNVMDKMDEILVRWDNKICSQVKLPAL